MAGAPLPAQRPHSAQLFDGSMHLTSHGRWSRWHDLAQRGVAGGGGGNDGEGGSGSGGGSGTPGEEAKAMLPLRLVFNEEAVMPVMTAANPVAATVVLSIGDTAAKVTVGPDLALRHYLDLHNGRLARLPTEPRPTA